MKQWLSKVSRFFGSRARAEAAQCKLALIGANKGLRRQKAKLNHYESFLETHQLWIEYKARAKEYEDSVRAAKKSTWLRTPPE